MVPWLAAAVIYQSWLVGLLIGHDLPWLSAYVSELAAQGQPHAWLYRTLDLTAGSLLVVGVLLCWRPLFGAPNPVNRPRTRWGLALIALAAVATVVDSRFPMRCASSLDPQCDALSGPGGVNDLVHQIASVTVSMAMVAAMVLLSWSVLHRRWLRVLAVVTIAMTLLTGVEGMLRDSVPGYRTVLGLVQMASIAALSVWWCLAIGHLLGAARSANRAPADPILPSDSGVAVAQPDASGAPVQDAF